MGAIVRVATKNDLEDIVKLLQKGKLNVEGIEEHIENFIVVEQWESKKVIATAGLEVFPGRFGLLRSLAFDAGHWDERAGMELVRIMLSYALRKGVTDLFLLTRSAPFLCLFGFQEIGWEEIPDCVQRSSHVQQVKSVLSTAMVYKSGDNVNATC